MAHVEITEPDGNKVVFFIDNYLKKNLDTYVKSSIIKKDDDIVFVIDGPERSGKSVFAMQLAKYLDETFDLSRVCMTPEEFKEAIENAEPKQAVIYDEAFTGLSSRRALTEINHLLVSMMMEMGQKNLIVLIVLPTFFMLDKYVALFRSRGLFHIYRKGTKKGYFMYFNSRRKQILYLKGQKLMSYSGITSNFRGRFFDKYIVDEQKYRKKKKLALENKTLDKKESRFQEQRNRLLYLLWREFVKNKREMEKLCWIYGMDLKSKQISAILTQIYPEVEPLAFQRKQELRQVDKIKEKIKKLSRTEATYTIPVQKRGEIEWKNPADSPLLSEKEPFDGGTSEKNGFLGAKDK